MGSGTVKLKYGPATGFDAPRTWESLSAQPAYQTHESMAASTSCALPVNSVNWARRPSIISATRYSTCPRLYAVIAAHFGNASRAARTASRRSFLDARATLAPSASYERPDSERGNEPPM
jgi:hypothetical protein